MKNNIISYHIIWETGMPVFFLEILICSKIKFDRIDRNGCWRCQIWLFCVNFVCQEVQKKFESENLKLGREGGVWVAGGWRKGYLCLVSCRVSRVRNVLRESRRVDRLRRSRLTQITWLEGTSWFKILNFKSLKFISYYLFNNKLLNIKYLFIYASVFVFCTYFVC